MKSETIAKLFNNRVSELKERHFYLVTAKIYFLECWVYLLKQSDEKNPLRRVLCAKYLDHKKYKKWNSNNGYVAGGVLPLAKILEHGPKPTVQAPLGAILEESSEEETSDCELNDLVSSIKYEVEVEDYPQAFSHFSYRQSKRRMIVCDLQGVLDSTKSPPLFELTDPVIHYSSKQKWKKGKHKFGRTDLGAKGINRFFSTHKCNNLCRLLGIAGQ